MSSPIILRWRIHNGLLPMRQRHFRAIRQLKLPDALLGWVHERLEWAMFNMLSSDSEAVLVLNIDPATEVRLTLEEVREIPELSVDDLRLEDGFCVGVTFDGDDLAGDIWIEQDGSFTAGAREIHTATSTLCRDLVQTLGYQQRAELLNVDAVQAASQHGQAFLISDEFGFVPIGSPELIEDGSATGRIRDAFARLW